jgi:hypothetical protein
MSWRAASLAGPRRPAGDGAPPSIEEGTINVRMRRERTVLPVGVAMRYGLENAREQR